MGGKWANLAALVFCFRTRGFWGIHFLDEESLFDHALEAGAQDVIKTADGSSASRTFGMVFFKRSLAKSFGVPVYAELVWCQKAKPH